MCMQFFQPEKIKFYSSETTSGRMTQLFCVFHSSINILDVWGWGWHWILWWRFWGKAWESFKWIWGPKLLFLEGKKTQNSDLLQMKAFRNTWVCWGSAQSSELQRSCPDSLSQLGTCKYEVLSCNHTLSNNTALEGVKNGKTCDNSSQKCL